MPGAPNEPPVPPFQQMQLSEDQTGGHRALLFHGIVDWRISHRNAEPLWWYDAETVRRDNAVPSRDFGVVLLQRANSCYWFALDGPLPLLVLSVATP